MTADEFLSDFVDTAADMVRGARASLAAWTQEEDIQRLTTAFLLEGDRDQLAILSFRLRTWARRQNVKAIVKARDKLTNLLEVMGNLALGAITP